jgi:hypothetical protein
MKTPALPVLLPVPVEDLVERIATRVAEIIAAQPEPPALLSAEQLAERLGVCARTIARRDLPHYLVAGAKRYDFDECKAALPRGGRR